MFIVGKANPLLGQNVLPGACQTEEYLPLLQGKRVALVANQTSVIGKTHLVDSLIARNVKIVKVFAPEHGFRGDIPAGETVLSYTDKKTKLQVISLYGSHTQPCAKDLKNVDVVIFDIQDVGTRFYTYLSTLHYVMQACAENHKTLLLLDRPNPNGHYTDGPVLKHGYESMVGLHPIPIVHGMTLGEMAKMVNGEKWLNTVDSCKLHIIKIKNWTHNTRYSLSIPPSPNLRTTEAILLYPTLCLLEGTNVSMGRGTDKPFECFGAPWLKEGNYQFVPRNIPGMATHPPYLGDTCHGFLVSDFGNNYIADAQTLYIEWLEMLLAAAPDRNAFFNSFFDKLAGGPELRLALLAGKSSESIRSTWKQDLIAYEYLRTPYLLYPYRAGAGLMDKADNQD